MSKLNKVKCIAMSTAIVATSFVLCSCLSKESNETTIQSTTHETNEEISTEVESSTLYNFEPVYLQDYQIVDLLKYVYANKPTDGLNYETYMDSVVDNCNLPKECYTNIVEYSGASFYLFDVGAFDTRMDGNNYGEIRNADNCIIHFEGYINNYSDAVNAYNAVYEYLTMDRDIYTQNYAQDNTTFWYTGMFRYEYPLVGSGTIVGLETSYITLTKLGDSKYLLSIYMPLYDINGADSF